MKLSIILCALPPNWFIYASGLASLTALIAIILYFVKPCLRIMNISDYSVPKVRIECINRNFFRNPILDVKCDIVASETLEFTISDTIELCKDWVPGISFGDNYIFKSTDVGNNFDKKRYLKIRILVVNVLGVRKLYQRIYKIR